MNGVARLMSDLDALAGFGRRPEGGWFRPAYSEIDQAAHDWLAGRMREAGLETAFDGAGNLVGRLPPTTAAADQAALLVGSHIDTVPGGGRLDGAYGVMAGIELARRLRESSAGRMRPLDVVAFRDEEGRFGPLTGSRMMTGKLDPARLPDMRAADGTRLADLLPACRLSPAGFAVARRPPETIAAYLEIHIEQGPVLESRGARVGAVTAIVGQARFTLRFSGRPDHAGTTPMSLRQDAFAAAAEFAVAFRGVILKDGQGVAVGTIGFVRVEPNAGNVVPAEARLGFEIRDVDGSRLDRLVATVERLATASAARVGVEVSLRPVHRTQPAPMALELQALIEQAASDRGLSCLRLPSGAGHDAQNFADLVPTAMIFVPSVGGRSHCPEESTEPADLAAGLDVLQAVAQRILAE